MVARSKTNSSMAACLVKELDQLPEKNKRYNLIYVTAFITKDPPQEALSPPNFPPHASVYGIKQPGNGNAHASHHLCSLAWIGALTWSRFSEQSTISTRSNTSIIRSDRNRDAGRSFTVTVFFEAFFDTAIKKLFGVG